MIRPLGLVDGVLIDQVECWLCQVLDDRTTALEQMVLAKSKMAQSKKYKKTSYEAIHETRRLWGEVYQVLYFSTDNMITCLMIRLYS